jgi:hypothetical protein
MLAGGVQELPDEAPLEDAALPDADMLLDAPELIDPEALPDAELIDPEALPDAELIDGEEAAALLADDAPPAALEVTGAEVDPGVDEVPDAPLLPQAAVISSTAAEMAPSAILVVRCGVMPFAPCSLGAHWAGRRSRNR